MQMTDTNSFSPFAVASDQNPPASSGGFSPFSTAVNTEKPVRNVSQSLEQSSNGESLFSSGGPAIKQDLTKPTSFSPFSTTSLLSELDHPETHPQLESKAEPSDPNAPWYKKLWETANAPLFDEETAKNWFGWDVEHWNGWGKGLFDLGAGLTSPLSIALAVGTFGSSSLIEAGGMTALKAAGMGAEEIAQVTKGSEILSKAIKMGHDTETAFSVMPSFGVDPALVKTGLDTLAKSGMKAESLISGGIVRRTGTAMLNAAKVDIGTADRIAQIGQLALDGGFTLQNAYGAVVAAPQVLDALKEGDYESAKRLAIDAVGSGAFAVLGGRQIHQHAGELMTDAEAAAGLRVKPSDENIKVMKILEPIEKERVIAGEREKTWETAARKEFEEVLPSDVLGHAKKDSKWIAGGANESDLRARFYRESEGNLDAWHDAIADAAGRPDEKIIKPAAPETIEHHDLEKMSSDERHDFINKNINTRLQATDVDAAKEEVKKLQSEGLIPKSFNPKLLSYTDAEGKLKYGVKWENVAAQAKINAPEDVARLQEAAAQKLFGKSYKDLDPTNIKDRMAAINEATKMQNEERLQAAAKIDTTFPPNIQDAIDAAKLKNKPKAYVDQLLKATDSKLLTEKEKAYAKHAGLHFDETGTRAVGEEALAAMAESYVTRVFKNANDVDSVRKFRSTIGSSDFSVNTAMARSRIFQTTLEGILKGHELENHDMIALAAHNGNEFSRIVSARQTLARLRGAGARASDGRNIAVLGGAGNVVESFDDKGNPVNPATIINPKGMQSIQMADKVVDGLRRNVIRPGVEEVKAGTSATSTTVLPETFLRRVGEAKGVMERHNVELEEKFKTSGGQWPSDVPPVKLMLDEGGNVIEADGRYRAALATQAGIERIPVEVSRPTPAVKGQAAFTELDKLMKEGRIVKYGVDKRTGRDLYAWTAHDYKTIDNPAFRGWKVPTTDTAGNPVYVQTELLIHPEAHEYLQRRFGVDEGVVKKIPGAKLALSAAREAKGWLLAFSPFHFMQEGLRAVMTGISPIGSEHFNPNNPMHVLAAEKGVWATKDYKGVRAFEDGLVGHSKIMAKIPVLREVQSWTQSMLFDRYIPGLKLRGFERMYEANKSLHPEWTKEKLANETAAEVNERFGGIDYKRIGRSAAAMDVARLTTLAPDWLESEMRFMKRTFTPGAEGTLARRDVLKTTLGLWAAARVLNYITTGQAHNEAPFGVAVKDEDGREKVYGIRTMPGDMLHMASDPIGFINGRQSPLLRTGIQTMTGRDEFGRKMSTNGIFVNLLRNVAPIGVQGVVKTMTGQDNLGVSNTDSLVKAGGLTVYPYRTEAQKEAAKLASSHAESGEVDQDKLKRHQGIIELENRLRSGKIPVTDLYKAVEQGQLHPDEVKKMLKVVKETQGLDPDAARLYAHVSRLPMKDTLAVWDKATSEEKAMLSKLLIKKQMNYMKKAAKEMSPAEKAADPVYQRLRRMFPQSAPF
jgi:hypothetical protein